MASNLRGCHFKFKEPNDICTGCGSRFNCAVVYEANQARTARLTALGRIRCKRDDTQLHPECEVCVRKHPECALDNYDDGTCNECTNEDWSLGGACQYCRRKYKNFADYYHRKG